MFCLYGDCIECEDKELIYHPCYHPSYVYSVGVTALFTLGEYVYKEKGRQFYMVHWMWM